MIEKKIIQEVMIGNCELSDFRHKLQKLSEEGFLITQSSINDKNIVVLVFEKEEVIDNGWKKNVY